MKIKLIQIIIPLMSTLLFFTSCSHFQTIETNVSKEGNHVVEEKLPIKKIEENTEQNLNEDNKTAFDPKHYAVNSNYGVALSTLKNNDMPRPKENVRWIRSLTINYPQLYNIQNEQLEERLNDILFKEVMSINDIINHRNYLEYNIDYEIMEADDKYLSILFTGLIQSPMRTNRVGYAVTISLNDGRLMELSEFYRIDNNFIKEHVHKDFKVIENNFNDINENNIYIENFLSTYEKNKHIHDYYIKDGNLGLLIPAVQSMAYILLEGNINPDFRNP